MINSEFVKVHSLMDTFIYVPYIYEPASMIYEINKDLVQKLLA